MLGDIHSFLSSQALPPTRLKLLELLDDPPTHRKLKIELAITVDAGEPFVKATYQLEGDGPLVFSAYDEICNLRATISNEYYPNVSAVAKDLSTVSSQSTQLMKYAKLCVKPAYEYFEEKFSEDLAIALSLFKCACLFDPSKVVDINPSVNKIEQLRVFPFLNSDSVIHELKTELPKYIAASHDVASTADRKGWWKRNSEILPSWSNACKSVLLIQPSSAAAERCFSILSNSFTNHQEHSLKDYIEISVMLQYNSRD